MKTESDIAAFVGQQGYIVSLLDAVAGLGLPDCWIGAGLIRNAVWDHLHGLRPTLLPGSDVDVIYFERRETDSKRDEDFEIQLGRMMPDIPWSVRNQARMHVHNADPPYRDSGDAVCHWPETATAIGARASDSGIEMLAPLGVSDLVNCVVRPTPAFADRPDVVRARLNGKAWPMRWSNLSIHGC